METIRYLIDAIKGSKTYSTVVLIILLAAAQKFLGLQVPNEVWIGLFGLALMFLRAATPTPPSTPPSAKLAGLMILAFGLCALPSRADTNGFPMLYAVQSAALEAHHGDTMRSSGVGAITHLGVDYGAWAIEAVGETPLYQTEQHTRRSVGADVLIKPWLLSDRWEPFLALGAGYYWGSDPYQCLAADAGLGVRCYVSRWIWLQLDARDAVPYGGRAFSLESRFQVVEIGIGGRF